MKLTSKGRYAVTAMLDLAMHSNEGPVALAEISQRQDLSLSYLEQLFTRLRKHELVYSTRGPGGGYSLSRSADDIAIAEVVSAVNENVDITQCGGKANCKDGSRCLTHNLWMELGDQIHAYLNNVSLGQVIARCDDDLSSKSSEQKNASVRLQGTL